MAEAVVGPIVEDIWKRLVAETSQQFGYLIHYNRNIKNLNEQVEKLESLIIDNRRFIQAAKDNNKEIRDEVENWMKRADGIMFEAKKIGGDANANKMCFFGWCPDLISCYRLSRKANKKVNTVTQLEEEGKFPDVSKPAPTPGIGTFLSTGDFVNFETTRSAMEKVMEALKEDKINVVGIHGMGGAGKTTMAKEIAKKAEEDKLLFDKVVFAVVSQTVDLKKIQDQLADQLGLRFEDQSELGRAVQLDIRLKNEKRILVILDDLWDRLDVKDIRIPMGVDHEGCKLIITTRRELVCRTMGMGSETTKIIHLGVLSEQESWDLFRIKVGDVIGSPTLMPVAQEVAAECGGLPIALVTVGRAMRDVKDEKEWKKAAKVLKKSMPTKIEGVEQEVFKCLKFSYDYLRDEEAKACFLLCSLFPEDHNIPIESLVRYGMGLGIFENVETVNEARDRTDSIINNLESSCLLMLAGNREGNVKMHDVVRDVAMSIGSKMYLVRAGTNLKEWPNLETLKDYTGISLMDNLITEHPDALECPNLQILMLQNGRAHQIPGVFKGMEALKVLDGSIVHSRSRRNYVEFEPSLRYLTNIRTLILEGWRFGDINALGEIKTLEILSFARCTFQESLDPLRHLTNLRLLDLRSCKIDDLKENLPRIVELRSSIVPQDVISRLSRLEEFYVEHASASWASEGSNVNLPRIVELSSLRHLTILTMHIDGLECITENFVFPDLEIFKIIIGPNYSFDDEKPNLHEDGKPNYLTIRGKGRQQKEMLPISSLNFFAPLFQKTNYLSLSKLEGFSNVFPDLSLDGHRLNVLKTLEVRDCDELEYLIHIKKLRIPCQVQQHQWLGFYDLEKLRLVRLKNFLGIYHGPTENIVLHNLQFVDIRKCKELKTLFLPAIARTLKNLEALNVIGCTKLKEIVAKCTKFEEIVAKEQEGQEEEEAAMHKIVFPRLRTLYLGELSNLNGFCIGSFPFEWPSLELVEVKRCPKMKTFTAAVPADGIQSTPKLNTIKLDDVEIDELDINSAIQKHFKEKNLQANFELFIEDCEALEAKELLANLKVLRLVDQHELKHLWKGPTAQVILHNLQEVEISRCNKLKSLFLPTIARTLEKLEYLKVFECDELEEIVAKEQEGHEEGEAAIHKIVFPQLKTLRLFNLPNLNGFCIGSFPFEWPSLELVKVYECPKMKTFTAAVPADGIQSTPKLTKFKLDGVKIDVLDINSAIQKHFKEKELYIKELLENKDFQANLKVLQLEHYHELKHLWKGPTALVILHNLQEVEISRCNKLKSLFLPTIARTLEKLEYLKVFECDELEEIVAKEQEGHEEGEAAIHKIVFPQLKTLRLFNLPNLNGFCIGSFPFEWPSLELVKVYECPKMKTFTAAVPADGIQSIPKLTKFKLDGVKIDVLDINSAIQEHFKEKSDESDGYQSTESD